jgi:hypothetical protein
MPGDRGLGALLTLVAILAASLLLGAVARSPLSAAAPLAPLSQPTPTPFPGGCPPLLYEGFESGTLGAFTSSGTNGWSTYTYNPWSGQFSARSYYMSNPPPRRR